MDWLYVRNKPERVASTVMWSWPINLNRDNARLYDARSPSQPGSARKWLSFGYGRPLADTLHVTITSDVYSTRSRSYFFFTESKFLSPLTSSKFQWHVGYWVIKFIHPKSNSTEMSFDSSKIADLFNLYTSLIGSLDHSKSLHVTLDIVVPSYCIRGTYL